MPRYFITGSSGSWGRATVKFLLAKKETEHIVALCRSESRAEQLLIANNRDPRLSIYLADIRDRHRIQHAMRGCTHVIHFAALKRIDAGLYSPTEMASINIAGTQSVIDAMIENQIERGFFTSSDKACLPSTYYGASKYIGEQLWLSANGLHGVETVAARFGNALNSTGSVLEVWQRCMQEGKPLPVRFDGSATRFVLTLKDGAKAVDWYLHNGESGKILAPELPTTTLYNLARAVAGDAYPLIWENVIPGEKKHEQLLPDGPTSAEGEHLTVDELREMLKEVQ